VTIIDTDSAIVPTNTESIVKTEPFTDAGFTAQGEPRARVTLSQLDTLWLNTGTLCNIACENCYIESTPTNDRLSYLTLAEALVFVDEIQSEGLGTRNIGITGGEPFMNPEILAIAETCLDRGFDLLILTNAMRPMMRPKIQAGLLDLNKRFRNQLTLRVSIDHFDEDIHEQERGPTSWQPMVTGLKWLQRNDFVFHIAGRTRWGDSEQALRQGFAKTLQELGITLDADNANDLVLFPEIDPTAQVPEITTECWGILGVNPDEMMCASSRMVVKHKDNSLPSVMACTLLPYEAEFDLGTTLKDALGPVALNHPSCAKFCVLGGGSCSG
jgi:organic radical activating enzyme